MLLRLTRDSFLRYTALQVPTVAEWRKRFQALGNGIKVESHGAGVKPKGQKTVARNQPNSIALAASRIE